MYYLSHGVPVATGRQKRGSRAARAYDFLCCTAIIILLLCQSIRGQQLEREFALTSGVYGLKQPNGMAASPRGERIAICDATANRIIVVDLQGRLLWNAGDQLDLRQPGAIYFESESEILYTPRNEALVIRLYEENPRAMDTVADLSVALKDWKRVDQIMPGGSGGFLVLNEEAGEVAAFTDKWEYDCTVVRHGSGKGMVILPTSMCLTSSRKLVMTDRKNYPVQIFATDGRFLFYGGWNQPSKQRGWEAVASAVDTRDYIWVADETNAQYRVFDQSGTEMSRVPFTNPSISVAAMLGTIDNHMVVLLKTGLLLFYTLE